MQIEIDFRQSRLTYDIEIHFIGSIDAAEVNMALEGRAPTEQVVQLRHLLNKEVESLEGAAWYNRRWAFRLRLGAAILGAFTTFLVGMRQLANNSVWGEWLSAIALFSSAALTVFSAWEAFFSNRELWVSKTMAAQKFRQIIFELDFLAADPGGVSKESLGGLFQRSNAAKEDAAKSWIDQGSRDKSH